MDWCGRSHANVEHDCEVALAYEISSSDKEQDIRVENIQTKVVANIADTQILWTMPASPDH